MRIGLGLGVGSGGGAPSWDPSSVSGLVDFYIADDTPEASTPRWPSNVASGRILSAVSSPTSPTYTAGQVHGRAGLLFNGTDRVEGATAADARLFHDGTGCTVVMVAYPTGTTTTQIFADTSNLTGTGFFISHDGSNNRWVAAVRNGGSQIMALTGSGVAAPENAPYTVVYRYKEALAPAEGTLFVNGEVAAQANTSSGPSAGDSVGPLSLGARSTSGSSTANGYIFVFLVYNRDLTDAEVANVSANARYAVSPRSVRTTWGVGDSTTFGTYQSQLQLLAFQTANTRIDFLGSLTAGSFPLSDFANDGHSGFRTDEIQDVLDPLPAIGGSPTDILLQAGINDVVDGVPLGTIVTNYTALGNYLKGLFPSASLRLGRPNRTLGGTAAAVAAFAAECPGIATAVGATYADTDVANDAEISGDNIHPTAAGYITIAGKWKTAMGF